MAVHGPKVPVAAQHSLLTDKRNPCFSVYRSSNSSKPSWILTPRLSQHQARIAQLQHEQKRLATEGKAQPLRLILTKAEQSRVEIHDKSALETAAPPTETR